MHDEAATLQQITDVLRSLRFAIDGWAEVRIQSDLGGWYTVCKEGVYFKHLYFGPEDDEVCPYEAACRWFFYTHSSNIA